MGNPGATDIYAVGTDVVHYDGVTWQPAFEGPAGAAALPVGGDTRPHRGWR